MVEDRTSKRKERKKNSS